MSREKLIMILDDDRDILDTYSHILRREGYEVITIQNVEEARDIFRERKPDLLLLDLELPDKSGFRLCHEVSRDFPDIRIVILSSKEGGGDREMARQFGAYGYIAKSASRQMMLSQVAQSLEHKGSA